MKPPRYLRTLIAVVLLSLGGIFTLLGELGILGVGIPMRGGEAWMFLPMGVLLLLTGAVLTLSVGWTIRRQGHLQTQGSAVPAQVIQVTCHPLICFGTDGVRKRHPWTALCGYTWEGRPRTAHSCLLWKRPSETGQRPTVYVDRNKPKRAWVDPESLRYETR